MLLKSHRGRLTAEKYLNAVLKLRGSFPTIYCMKQNIKLAQGEKKERETVVESNTEVPQESTLPSSWRPPPKPTTEVQLSVLQHLHLHHLTLTPGALPACLHRDLSTTLPRSSSTWGLRTRKTPKKQDQPCLIYFFFNYYLWGHQEDHQVEEQKSGWGDSFAATVPARSSPSSMQVITCALFTLVSLPISSSASEAADSCPTVCECSEWKTQSTISCFDIDILPRFPASTETL